MLLLSREIQSPTMERLSSAQVGGMTQMVAPDFSLHCLQCMKMLMVALVTTKRNVESVKFLLRITKQAAAIILTNRELSDLAMYAIPF